MKKKNINFILYLIIFLFAGIIVFAACKQTNQPFLAMSLQLKFVGEYSQDGEAWQTLSEDVDLSAFDGDLALRGRFDPELPEGACVYFYLDHIGMNVSVNGEDTYEMSNEINSDLCGTGWQEWILPAMSENDVIEISSYKLKTVPRYLGGGKCQEM